MIYARIDSEGWLIGVYQTDEPGLNLIPVPQWSGWPARPDGTPLGSRLMMRRVGVTWDWQDPRSDAQVWAEVRERRDALLAATDWVTLRAYSQGAPVPGPWAAYQQALRDITKQADPRAIAWPVAPG